MMRITLHIATCLFLSLPLAGQVPARTMLQAGDTLYKSWDLLPQNVALMKGGQSTFWDLSGLLAPYVHEIYVRPVPARRDLPVDAEMAYTDAYDVERFFRQESGSMYLVGYGVTLFGNTRVVGACDPPILWRNGNAQEGTSWTHSGTVTFHLRAGAPIQPEIAANDSMRITFDLESTSEIAGSGEVLTPSGLYDVMYKRQDMVSSASIQRYRDGRWEALSTVVPMDYPRDLSTGRVHTFLSNLYPDPVAVAYADIFDNLSSVEFRSSPRFGRLVRSSPRVPDVFVYPNPSFGQVRFDFVNLQPGFYQIEVYNILGVKVRTEDLYINGTRTVPMDLTDLKKGTYIYRLVDAQKNALRSKRLVIITP